MIRFTADPIRLEIHLTGHADADKNEQGHDLVCCAASTLIQTYAQALHDCDKINTYSYAAHGDMRVGLNPEAGPGPRNMGFIVYRTIFTGLRMLSEQYPDHIQFVSTIDDGG